MQAIIQQPKESDVEELSIPFDFYRIFYNKNSDIDTAKQLAKETDAAGIILETEKANTIGNKLYPSSGFVPIKIIFTGGKIPANYFNKVPLNITNATEK
jgi:hypothetical protein